MSLPALANPLIVSHLILGEEKKLSLNSSRIWIEDSKMFADARRYENYDALLQAYGF